MKKMFKLFIRIIITIALITIICIIIEKFLEIKHQDKMNDGFNENFDWSNENDIIAMLLDDKYSGEKEENYMIITRKDSHIFPKSKAEKRILVIGDSYIYGTSLTNVNYTWWKQLNLRIKEAGYSNVNVYGVGLYGYSTKDEIDNILNNEELIKKIDPDLIIIGYVSNDPEEKDEYGKFVVEADWALNAETSEIYQENPALYYELVDRMYALGSNDYDKIIEIGDKLGVYRWDARLLYIVQGDRLTRYKEELKRLKSRMEEIDIPYFVTFTNNIDNPFVEEANKIVYEAMKELDIPTYFKEYSCTRLLLSIGTNEVYHLNANPADLHPGIVWNYDYSKKIYDLLKEKYNFIFDDSVIEDLDNLELNINDTTPYLKLNKISKNIFEFEYPKFENERTKDTNFLYYPIEKNYIKLNLEYPKNVKKVIVTGDELRSAEVYANVINPKYGYDIDEAFQKVTPCDYNGDDTYNVNKEITSVNIHAIFKNDNNRKLKIEFVE